MLRRERRCGTVVVALQPRPTQWPWRSRHRCLPARCEQYRLFARSDGTIGASHAHTRSPGGGTPEFARQVHSVEQGTARGSASAGIAPPQYSHCVAPIAPQIIAPRRRRGEGTSGHAPTSERAGAVDPSPTGGSRVARMSDDEESPTISGAEMAARFGMTEDELMASIAENDLRKQLEIVVNIDDLEHGTWFASCGACDRGILAGGAEAECVRGRATTQRRGARRRTRHRRPDRRRHHLSGQSRAVRMPPVLTGSIRRWVTH